jgi:hypothetical protein
MLEALCDGIATLARRAEPDPLARRLAALIAEEVIPARVALLALAARDLPARLSPSAGVAFAEGIADRMILEPNPLAFQSLVPLLAPVAGELHSETLAKLAGRAALGDDSLFSALLSAVPAAAPPLIEGANAAQSPWRLELLAEAAPKAGLPEPELVRLAGVLSAALDVQRGRQEVVGLTFGLAALPTPAAELEDAAALLAGRFAGSRDPFEISLLASGLHAVRSKLGRESAAAAATRLAARIAGESDPALLVRLGLALDAVSAGWSAQQANGFARAIEARMTAARGAATVRVLAFLLRAGAKQADEEYFRRAAELLVSRLEQSSDPETWLMLAMGLRALDDRAGEQAFARAADYLAGQPREAAEALAALRPLSPREPYARAAARIADELAQARDPAAARELALALDGLKVETLSAEDLARLDPVFRIPDAPCQIIASVRPADRRAALIRQLRNPLCGEASWRRLASLFLGEETEEEELSLEALAGVEDDDGERGEESEAAEIDFNALSDALPALPAGGARWPVASLTLLAAAAAAVLADRLRRSKP